MCEVEPATAHNTQLPPPLATLASSTPGYCTGVRRHVQYPGQVRPQLAGVPRARQLETVI